MSAAVIVLIVLAGAAASISGIISGIESSRATTNRKMLRATTGLSIGGFGMAFIGFLFLLLGYERSGGKGLLVAFWIFFAIYLLAMFAVMAMNGIVARDMVVPSCDCAYQTRQQALIGAAVLPAVSVILSIVAVLVASKMSRSYSGYFSLR